MSTAKDLNLLLVSDDPTDAKMIRRVLAAHPHYLISSVESIKKARQILRKSHLDIIITDESLADGFGSELLTANLTCPAIVLTGEGTEKLALKVSKAGSSEIIVKSAQNIEALPATVDRVIREWQFSLDQKLAAQHQQRLTAILEATPDLISISNLDGFLTYINSAGRKMLGIEDNLNISRLRLIDFHGSADSNMILSEAIPTAIREGLWRGESAYITPNGADVLTSVVMVSHCSEHGDIEFFSTIARDITHLREAEEKVEYLEFYDNLTGLPNREELLKLLDIEIVRVGQSHLYAALLFIDLDNFKNINDSLGHPVGDEVLQEMALRLKSIVGMNNIVSRLGGDEFVVMLSGLNCDLARATEQVSEVSERVCQQISQEYKTSDIDLHLTASIGISLFSGSETTGHDLLKFADIAMYQAKKLGRNRFEFFSEHMSSDVSRQLNLENDLRRALRESQFRLFYQPLVDAKMKVIGAEALIRWQHPVDGLVGPQEFLDVLESSGQILDVGNWVIATALHQISTWIDEGIWTDDMEIGINTSPRQFGDSQFTDTVRDLLEQIHIPQGNIVIEVTEHNIIDDIDDAINKMDELIEFGVSFSLDDFGTGYSSLSHLKNLPVSHIKIDQSFVADICKNSSDEAMVGSILAMSKHLGLKVVAEGVETKDQFELLKKYNCKCFQGYFFSNPLPADEMEAYLRSQ